MEIFQQAKSEKRSKIS